MNLEKGHEMNTTTYRPTRRTSRTRVARRTTTGALLAAGLLAASAGLAAAEVTWDPVPQVEPQGARPMQFR